MPTISRDGIELHYIERGSGDQTVVFSHSYLVDHRHFEAQIEALSDRYRVIAYDHRDLGQSGRASKDYGIYDLVADGVAIIEETGAAPCHWIGLSTGGFVGVRIAVRHPQLLRSLVLMDTSPADEPLLKRIKYRAMLGVLRVAGVKPLIGTAVKSMFGKSSLRDPEMKPVLATWRERMLGNDPAALIRFGKAIWSRDDVRGHLGDLDLPVLVVHGAEDVPLPVSIARETAEAIPGARLEIVERAGHLCTVEQPDMVSEILGDFLDGEAQGELAG